MDAAEIIGIPVNQAKCIVMKITALIFIFGIFLFQVHCQNITATTPAKLQVYATKPDGSQALITWLMTWELPVT